MIAEIGLFALILALPVALVQGVVPLLGFRRGDAAWMAVARPAAQAQLALIAIAFAALTHAFVTSDFSLAVVAQKDVTVLAEDGRAQRRAEPLEHRRLPQALAHRRFLPRCSFFRCAGCASAAHPPAVSGRPGR